MNVCDEIYTIFYARMDEYKLCHFRLLGVLVLNYEDVRLKISVQSSTFYAKKRDIVYYARRYAIGINENTNLV